MVDPIRKNLVLKFNENSCKNFKKCLFFIELIKIMENISVVNENTKVLFIQAAAEVIKISVNKPKNRSDISRFVFLRIKFLMKAAEKINNKYKRKKRNPVII